MRTKVIVNNECMRNCQVLNASTQRESIVSKAGIERSKKDAGSGAL